jgi:hypothetical protein
VRLFRATADQEGIMYLQKCTIRNIKCFEDVTLDFRQPDGSIRLWNVIIGENGTGKSTLLQAVAIALIGERAAWLLNLEGWVRKSDQEGEIEVTIEPGTFDIKAVKGDEKAPTFGKPIRSKYVVAQKDQPSLSDFIGHPLDFPKEFEIANRSGPDRTRLNYLHSSNPPGWFAAGYGPFRRLSGGSEQTHDAAGYSSRVSRFITLFREDAALLDCERWLMALDYSQRDDSSGSKYRDFSAALLKAVKDTLNNQFLPDKVRLEAINSQGVYFRTPYADRVQMSDLSDGYRSMIALGIDLIHHLSNAYPELWSRYPDWLQHVTGVVLIDELDAHLHPTWQRQISFWLKKRFPKLQFIVATHSPFISQAADDDGLFVLRRPGPETNSVQAFVDERSVRGWRADQILSILFDTPSVYDPETEGRLREYGRLKSLSEMGRLPEDQAQTFAELQEWVDKYLAPPGDTRDEMQEFRALDRRVSELSRMLRERRADDKG